MIVSPDFRSLAVTTDAVVDWLLGPGLRILVIVTLAFLVRWALHRAIDRAVSTTTARSASRVNERRGVSWVLAQAAGIAHERHVQRTRTLGSLLKSIASVVIFGIAILTVMALLGIPLAPLLASAGVGGVALGFGAQSLVKDFLSGIFMIIEDQYGVGDLVDTGEVTGTIEEVSLRVTTLRDINGVTWYVRNGEILRIGNHSQGNATAIVDIPFSYKENVDRVIALIEEVGRAMFTDHNEDGRLIEPPNVLGVESMQAGSLTVRALATCRAGTQWGVQRELRRRIKDRFDEEGIQGPEIVVGQGGAP